MENTNNILKKWKNEGRKLAENTVAWNMAGANNDQWDKKWGMGVWHCPPAPHQAHYTSEMETSPGHSTTAKVFPNTHKKAKPK